MRSRRKPTSSGLRASRNSLSASVSAAYQRHQEHAVDLLEAFVSFLPPQKGPVGFSDARRASCGPKSRSSTRPAAHGARSTRLRPSAINAWVGEEVKVLGRRRHRPHLDRRQRPRIHGIAFSASTTRRARCSRSAAGRLHNEKATVFGHFPLPPLNPFITLLQQHDKRGRSSKSIIGPASTAGSSGDRRLPFGAALFYYDNRGDPRHSRHDGQWGWRTRFWNLGINADLTLKDPAPRPGHDRLDHHGVRDRRQALGPYRASSRLMSRSPRRSATRPP